MIVNAEHKLSGATFLGSPHFDDRPGSAQLELIVVHCVSLPEGEFGNGYARALFKGELDTTVHETFADLEGVEVSPHLLIDRDGSVEQFVSFDKRAWHAGPSSWCRRSRCNDFSIGIELEGSINSSYTLAQYDALVDVVVALFDRYPQLSSESVVGHNEIAPLRKQDPGAYFDWRGVLLRLHKVGAERSAEQDNATI